MARASLKQKSSKGRTQEPRFESQPLSGGGGKTKSKKKKPQGPKASDLKKTELERELKSLRKMLDKDEGTDSMAIAMTKAFLRTALESVAIAEKAYKSNPHAHNSYALNGLMNQTRELAADLRSLQTVETNRQEQIATIIQTAMRRFGMQILQQIQAIELETQSVKDKTARRAIVKQCRKSGKEIVRYANEAALAMVEEANKV